MDICSKDQPVRFSYSEMPSPRQEDHPRHMHSEYELLLFMAGGPSYVVDGRKYPLSSYTLLLVPPNSYHFALVEDAPLYCRYLLNFKGDAFSPALLQKVFSEQACYQLDADHGIVQAFRRLHALNRQELSEHQNLLLQSFCSQILLEILVLNQTSSVPVGPETGMQPYPVLAYINRHLTTIKTAEEIASAFYISTSTLCHQFRARMGISLMKYIRQKRLLLAKNLLEKGEKAMDVCTRCGFAEYTTFYKAYVRYFGTPPSKTE